MGRGWCPPQFPPEPSLLFQVHLRALFLLHTQEAFQHPGVLLTLRLSIDKEGASCLPLPQDSVSPALGWTHVCAPALHHGRVSQQPLEAPSQAGVHFVCRRGCALLCKEMGARVPPSRRGAEPFIRLWGHESFDESMARVKAQPLLLLPGAWPEHQFPSPGQLPGAPTSSQTRSPPDPHAAPRTQEGLSYQLVGRTASTEISLLTFPVCLVSSQTPYSRTQHLGKACYCIETTLRSFHLAQPLTSHSGKKRRQTLMETSRNGPE